MMERNIVSNCPTIESSYTNRAIVNPASSLARFEHIAITGPGGGQPFIFSIATDRNVKQSNIAFNACGRKWASLMAGTTVEAAEYKFIPELQCLNTVTCSVDFAVRATAPKDAMFDSDEMSRQFITMFANQAITVGQLFGFCHKYNENKVIFELKVKSMASVNMEQTQLEIGLITPNTVVMFEPADSSGVNLTGGKTSTDAAPRVFNQDWDFEKMGIGGLSEQFNLLFRRAFAARLLPPSFAQNIGEDFVKGILLYGPPGTGKTLIARQIGKMLLAREPKVVNGPEVLNKFVGESEANIRKLFAEAEEEQAKMGLNSGLHLIIFDEIDAICKSRGNSASSSGVGDSVVNQLLTKIDGVNALHNVLLIGMTNRRDLIDEALLRPGRFELQLEIGLPNRKGRVDILKIHTQKLRDADKLDPSVNLEDIADKTKNFSGAELAGLVRAARSLAIERITDIHSLQIDAEALKEFKVKHADFLYSLNEVKPAYGTSDDTLKKLAGVMMNWDTCVAKIEKDTKIIIRAAENNSDGQPFFVLLVGGSRSGKTTIAANMAASSGFPFVRYYGAENSIGNSENTTVQDLKKLFTDASRSELSCLVIDDLELLMDYCEYGPRYSLGIHKAIAAKRNMRLPDGRRMLVICTCESQKFLDELKLRKIFRSTIRVPSITRADQVGRVLNDVNDQVFDEIQLEELESSLESLRFEMGIGRLLDLINDTKEEIADHRLEYFLREMHLSHLVKESRMLESFRLE